MGQIKVKKNVGGIEGLCIIEPTLHGDSRGYFMETYNKNDMAEAGLTMEFVQDNQSASTKGVLRGLHFQKQHPQGKLVRVINGTVFDVVVEDVYKRQPHLYILKWIYHTLLLQILKVSYCNTSLKNNVFSKSFASDFT